jgi:hypothetical protein
MRARQWFTAASSTVSPRAWVPGGRPAAWAGDSSAPLSRSCTVAASGWNAASPTGSQAAAASSRGRTLRPSISASWRGAADSAGQPSQPLDSDWP